MNRVIRKTCSTTFRSHFLNKYPGLNDSPHFMSMLQYVIFGCDIGDEGLLLISRERIAEIEEVELTSKYVAEPFLKAYQSVFPNFLYSDWSKKEGKCRWITASGLDSVDDRLIELELANLFNDNGRVYFTTGNVFSAASVRRQSEEIKTIALNLSSKSNCEDSKKLLNYMNTLPVRPFTKILENLEEAFLLTKTYSKETKLHQQKVLASIKAQVQPYYQTSQEDKTVRIFGLTESILMLKKEVRKVLCKGWVEVDLRSSQLAIIAGVCRIPAINSFLIKGGNIWDELGGLITDSNTKKQVKTAMYSIIFGGGRETILETLTNVDSKEFFSHWIIEELMVFRDRMLTQIKKDGGAYDCYGRFIAIDRSRNVSERSVLAQVAQALELKLLIPVIDYATSSPDFTITLWQHDGFCVSMSRKRDTEKIMKDIANIVSEVAKSLGVITNVEWSQL